MPGDGVALSPDGCGDGRDIRNVFLCACWVGFLHTLMGRRSLGVPFF